MVLAPSFLLLNVASQALESHFYRAAAFFHSLGRKFPSDPDQALHSCGTF